MSTHRSWLKNCQVSCRPSEHETRTPTHIPHRCAPTSEEFTVKHGFVSRSNLRSVLLHDSFFFFFFLLISSCMLGKQLDRMTQRGSTCNQKKIISNEIRIGFSGRLLMRCLHAGKCRWGKWATVTVRRSNLGHMASPNKPKSQPNHCSWIMRENVCVCVRVRARACVCVYTKQD